MIKGSLKVSKRFKGCLKVVSKMFQGRFEGGKEHVKCVSRKFHKNFQGCFKNLSMKFCFAIML